MASHGLHIRFHVDDGQLLSGLWRAVREIQRLEWDIGQTLRVHAIRSAVRREMQRKFRAMMAARFPELQP